ncbi:hypothetical protein IE077_001702 [Cardiosporidium cionae]|uniref:Coatomer alpha subunit C-terminal domain-containing protein n=1 Tax=Cardiosporidium cionae TaxID=476202 RepID=A0ABQ7J3U6_9APIC|nr:hypothetical protein IE077_001702 [Cardiosporidium cionae]|eukprot:KAF8817771.1 hypothetical protein IE077_001702 [Cardiosporidium cionae]
MPLPFVIFFSFSILSISFKLLIFKGEFEQALAFLSRRISLKNPTPLKPLFINIYHSSWTSLPGLPFTHPMNFPILQNGSLNDEKITPLRVYSPSSNFQSLRSASRLLIGGKFEECLQAYREILQRFPFIVATSAEENSQLMESLAVCRISTLAMQLECCRQKLEKEEIVRNLELVSYLGCCPLPPHFAVLTVRRAMITTYKAGNFLTASFFAKRLMENSFLNSKQNSDEIYKAKQMFIRCEAAGTDAYKLNFSRLDAETLQICSSSLTPISSSEESICCPFCKSVAHKKFSGTLCSTCELSELGGEVINIFYYFIY